MNTLERKKSFAKKEIVSLSFECLQRSFIFWYLGWNKTSKDL